jgi:nucleoside phosphorylase
MENNLIKKILYVIVLAEESSAILEKEDFQKEENLSKEYSNILEAFVSKKDEKEVYIIRPLEDPLHSTSLFGTEISFFITYMGIKLFNPDVVISMGYAGEVSSEKHSPLGIGSVVIAKEHSIYHRREMIVKIYENTSFGLYPVHSCDSLVHHLGFHSCKVGTSNSFLRHDHVAISKEVRVVEMELCSVARACFYFKKPCIGVKIISDGASKEENLTEEERVKQFLDSLPLLKEKFDETYLKVNEYLFGKQIDQL